MASEWPDISPSKRKVYRRFERWRSTHPGRLPIPERLWAAAVDQAQEHGVFRTAKTLRLEYGKLKQLVEVASPAAKEQVKKAPAAAPRRARSTAASAFVELITPQPGRFPEGVVELEGPRGRMRVELKGIATADLVAHQLQVLLAAGDPTATQAAPVWRRVSASG